MSRSTVSVTSPARHGALGGKTTSPLRVASIFRTLSAYSQALTQYLGFPYYGDEYKAMGLAPYGSPSRMEAMGEIVKLTKNGAFMLDLAYFRHHRERIAYSWDSGSPEFGDLFSPALEELLGPRRRPQEPLEERHRDIARSVQARYEEAFFHLIAPLQQRFGLSDIALAGGCAMNSVANGKSRRMTPFRRVHSRVARSKKSAMRRSSADARRPRSPKAPCSAGFKGGWSGVRGRSATDRSSAIRGALT